MESNKRYSILRGKLDQFNYMQTLHPDCVPLVQKLFADYLKATQNYYNEKQKNNPKNNLNAKNQMLKELEIKFDVINKQNTNLMNENKILKEKQQELILLKKQKMIGAQDRLDNMDAQKRIKMIRDKYDNKIKEFSEKNMSLQKELQHINSEKQSIEQRLQALLQQNSNLNDEKAKIEKLYLQVNHQKNILQNEINESSKNKEYEVNKQKIMSLQKELEGSERDKKKYLVQNKNSIAVIQNLKNEIKQLEKSNLKLKNDNEQQQKLIENLKKQKISLESQLNDYKNQQYEFQIANENKELSKNRMQTLYQQSLKILETKKFEIEGLNHEIIQNKKQFSRQEQKIKQLSSKNLILNRNIGDIQNQIQNITNKFSQKLKQNRELESQKAKLERQLRQVQPFRQKYQELQMQSSQKYNIEQNLIQKQSKNKKSIQKQAKLYQQEINILKQNQQNLIIKNQKLVSELKRMQLFITNGNKQIQFMNTQKQNLIKQNKELQDILSNTQNSDFTNKTSTLKLQQKITSYELLIQDLKSTLQSDNNKQKVIIQQINNIRNALKISEDKNKQLHNDNITLRRACESLQNTKNQLFNKLKQFSSQKNLTQQEKLKYHQQIDLLKQQLNRARHQLQKQKASMIDIDDQRDQFQNGLDEKTQQNARLIQKIRNLQNQRKAYDKQIDKNEMNIHMLNTQLLNLTSDYDKLMKNYEGLSSEYNICQERLKVQERQLANQSNQIRMITISNKDIQKQLQRLKIQNTEESKRFKQRTMKYDQLRKEIEIQKITNQQYLEKYKAERTQTQRLESIVNQLATQNNSMFNHLSQRDRQIREYIQCVKALENQIKRYQTQIISYQRDRQHLAYQIQLREEQIRNINIQMQVIKNQNYKREPQIDWKPIYQEKLSKLHYDYESKRRQCQAWRDRARQLQKQRTMNKEIQSRITPVKTIMSQSNSRFNNNQYQNNENSRSNMNYSTNKDSLIFKKIQKQEELDESFNNSTESISSKMLQQKLKKIEQQYALTIQQTKKVKR